MPITNIKIFPSIGIARLGNSPTDFFIGPEIPGVIPNPPGGYKDDQCRIKRQAARFRLFGYDGDTLVREITSAEANISWEVHLVHGKSAHHFDTPSHKIDPGARTITGPLKKAQFDTGTFEDGSFTTPVDLGEIRTDEKGRLLVLGGFGNSGTADPARLNDRLHYQKNKGWYDDASDGSVKATVTINGNSIPVQGAWVIVGPPDFAPAIGNAISLYDRLLKYHVEESLLPNGFPLPTDANYQPSFNRDIYPLLKRGWEDVQEVLDVATPISLDFNSLSNNSAANQAARTAVMQGLRRNGGPVPRSGIESGPGESPDVTPLQFAMLQKWEAGNFINDWTGSYVPDNSITPEGLTKAALDNATGGIFHPGIEAGNQLINSPNKYIAGELLRINHNTINPGDITKDMAVPWQADFSACNKTFSGGCTIWVDTAWWPTQRPIKVLDAYTGSKINWDGVANSFKNMIAHWHTLGFVVNNQGVFQDSERCNVPSITLLTPTLNFNRVPLGPGNLPRPVAQAIVFEVISPTMNLNFNITHHPTAIEVQPLQQGPFLVDATQPNTSRQLLIPIRYNASNAGSSVATSITIENVETGRSWTIPITASTGDTIKNAVALVLDRSGSMNQDRGDGQPKVSSLRSAVKTFVDLMVDGDAAALIRYNEDAQEILPMTTVDSSNPGISANIKNTVDGSDFDPSGFTSIGDGIVLGRAALNNASGFDTKSMVILTDGKENRDSYIEDVAAQVNEQTYAIGLGTPANVDVTTLQQLTGNNGGYLLITGDALTGNNQFRLQKQFMQILTGINNKDIIYDPDGTIYPGQDHKIPFLVSDAEIGVDVILLTPNTKHLQLLLQAPSGQIYDAGQLSNLSNVKYVHSSGVIYYRFSLPIEVIENRFEYLGQWQAVVRYADQIAHGERPIPYSLNVHAYSSLQFDLAGHPCGSNNNTFLLSGALQQYGSVAIAKASIWAEIEDPMGNTSRQNIAYDGTGKFELKYNSCLPGLHTLRVIAHGTTLQGAGFTREKTLTFPVVSGTEFQDRGSTWEKDVPDPTDKYLVYGTITNQDQRPVEGVIIKAVDQDFVGENPLGKETRTNSKGQYKIPYLGSDFIIDGKETGGADIILYVYDEQGELLYRAEPRRNSPRVREINLSIKR